MVSLDWAKRYWMMAFEQGWCENLPKREALMVSRYNSRGRGLWIHISFSLLWQKCKAKWNLRKEGFIWAHGLRMSFTMIEKLWHKHEVGHYLVLANQKQRNECWCSAHFSLFLFVLHETPAHGMIPSTLSVVPQFFFEKTLVDMSNSLPH